MVSRLIVAYDAVDVADAVNQVIVFLMNPNTFDQLARTILNPLGVVRDEIEHGVLGSVVEDADYLIALLAELISVSPRSARDRVIGARMIISFVFRRNVASVAPFFILALFPE